MAGITSFKGGRELVAALQSLPAKVEQNVMRSAMRQGANVVRDEARENVQVKTGKLRKSIRVSTSARRGVVTATVATGDRKAHLIEFGTAAHLIKPKKKDSALAFGSSVVADVNHPGSRPFPFMRTAADTRVADVLAAVGEQVRRRLTKEGINAPAGLDVDQ